MQLTINDMPEPPEGYEYTGEYRKPREGEYALHNTIVLKCDNDEYNHFHFILRKKRWRASKGSKYFNVECYGKACHDTDMQTYGDDLRYEIGNYFKTEAEAQKAADKLKEFLMQFHGGE